MMLALLFYCHVWGTVQITGDSGGDFTVMRRLRLRATVTVSILFVGSRAAPISGSEPTNEAIGLAKTSPAALG